MTMLFQLCKECAGSKIKKIRCGICRGVGPCNRCNHTGKIDISCEKCLGVGHTLTKEGKILEEIFEARRDFIED
jgi:hypothetical protein